MSPSPYVIDYDETFAFPGRPPLTGSQTFSDIAQSLQLDFPAIDMTARLVRMPIVLRHGDIETSVRLSEHIPNDRLFVVESGIQSKQDIDKLLDAGADAFLIGEHLITSSDPAAAR